LGVPVGYRNSRFTKSIDFPFKGRKTNPSQVEMKVIEVEQIMKSKVFEYE